MSSALLRRFPKLSVPYVVLGTWPTPVRRLPLGEGARGSIWVKDESRAGGTHGGNKVRKLEFLLGRATEKGATDLVTVGAVGSNHVLATAIFARQLGLRTHAVLIPQVPSDHVDRTLEAIRRECETVRRTSTAAVPIAALAAFREIRAAGGRPMWIPHGGSSKIGNLGWVSCGLEIAEQVAAGDMPAPDRVFVPWGSGGTAIGLWVGLRLGGLSSEVVAVAVLGWPRPVARLWAFVGAKRLLAVLGNPKIALSGFRLNTRWIAGGYGRADDRVARAMEAGTALGLPMEATYTAKALGACMEEAREKDGVSLYVATLNGVALGACGA